MPIQTLANTPNENKTFYNRTLISRLLPTLLFAKHGQKRSTPKKEGDTVNFRKFAALPAATTALTEGVTPTGSNITITKVEATVAQYGDFVPLADTIDLMGIDPVVTETSCVLAEQAGLTIDTVVRDIVCAGTNVLYAGNRASTAAVTSADKITSAEIKKAVKILKRSNAKPMDGKYFYAFIDPEASYDIQNDPMWQDLSKYGNGAAIQQGEIGKIHGVKFFETTNTKVKAGTGGLNVHCTIIFGKDSYGVCDIEKGSTPEIIVKEAGSAGTADPLNQRSSVGWKALFTAVRLEELSLIRIEHAVTE